MADTRKDDVCPFSSVIKCDIQDRLDELARQMQETYEPHKGAPVAFVNDGPCVAHRDLCLRYLAAQKER